MIEMEDRREITDEKGDKWKDHGWKAWKWSVAMLTLHSAAKAKVEKVAKDWLFQELYRSQSLALTGLCQWVCNGHVRLSSRQSGKDTTTPMLSGGKMKVS